MKRQPHVHRPADRQGDGPDGWGFYCRVCARRVVFVPADTYRAAHWRAAPKLRA